jgi:uncharacterized protein YlaN (UPF0358 family)
MKLVLEVLSKELERQHLLIATNENMLEGGFDFTMPRHPLPEEIYPKMYELRDELEKAIKILSLERWQKT